MANLKDFITVILRYKPFPDIDRWWWEVKREYGEVLRRVCWMVERMGCRTVTILAKHAFGGGGVRPRVETDWLNTSSPELSHIINEFVIVVFEEFECHCGNIRDIDDQIVIFICY